VVDLLDAFADGLDTQAGAGGQAGSTHAGVWTAPRAVLAGRPAWW
jgi:hypothetical protein